MATVTLVGAFGQRNPGDEALCAAFRERLAGHQLVVVSGDPDDTARRHRVRSSPATPLGAVGAVMRSDALVIAGGTIFKSLHRSTGRRRNALLRNTMALVALARARRAKVAMIGVGADDLRGQQARRIARWLVGHVDLLVLRDEESAAVLAAAGAPTPMWIGADPAWLLAPDIAATADPPRKHESSIVVALSHLAGDGGLVANLAAALRSLREDYSVHLQPWQVGAGGRDLELAESLRERLGSDVKVLDAPDSLASAVATSAAADLVVGLRFHALVAAGIAGTRFVAIAHEPKLAGVARRLGQLSVPSHASADVLAAAIAGGLGGDPVPPAAVAAEVTTAERMFGMLDLLLSGGAADEPERVAGLTLSDGAGTW
jgi:polysaccharide pyruvyl transferase WcaK-like protein